MIVLSGKMMNFNMELVSLKAVVFSNILIIFSILILLVIIILLIQKKYKGEE